MTMNIILHSPKISRHISHSSISFNLFLLCSSCLVWGISAFAVPTITRTTKTCGSRLCPRGTQQRQQQRGERHVLKLSTSSDTGSDIDYEIEPLPIRIGHGFDIHRMAPLEEAGQPLIIGGVVIPHSNQKWTDVKGTYVERGGIYETQLGVVAHSDGDVIYHSVVDAIFGALTLPDIGQVFRDTDPRWRGCDSSKFVEHAYDIMHRQYGYRLGNCDVTLILERPKVANFKPAMKENLVRLLRTTPGRVNIKARTHEQMDSVGELRSLSCHVVLTLERVKENEM